MPSNNKVTERSFTYVMDKGGQKKSYENFLSIDHELGIPESELLKNLKERYSEIAQNCVDDIKILAALEELIVQIRSKEVIDSELRLSLSRDYIYARTTFFRRGKEINDIRVIIGKVDEYPDSLEDLLKNPDFRVICKNKLIEAMNKEIEKNINQLNFEYKYE